MPRVSFFTAHKNIFWAPYDDAFFGCVNQSSLKRVKHLPESVQQRAREKSGPKGGTCGALVIQKIARGKHKLLIIKEGKTIIEGSLKPTAM